MDYDKIEIVKQGIKARHSIADEIQQRLQDYQDIKTSVEQINSKCWNSWRIEVMQMTLEEVINESNRRIDELAAEVSAEALI